MKDMVQEIQTIPRFSTAERDRRWGIARQIMDEQDLEGLVVFGSREGAFPAPFTMDTYFTNDRPGALVVFPRQGAPRVLAFALAANDHMQALDRGEDVWIQPEHFYAGAPNGQLLALLMQELGLGQKRIGVIGLDSYPPFYFGGAIPYTMWKAVLDTFPKATFVPVGNRFFELTVARSDEELAVLRWSANVGEAMAIALRDAVRPGVHEGQLYSAAIAACSAQVGFTAELLLQSGKDFISFGPPGWTYRPQAPRVIEDGDVIAGELFSSLGLLETQHQITVAVGKVHADYERAAETARASYEAGLAAARPGVTFGEVVDAMQAPLKQAGGFNVHPFLHSINPFGLVCGFVEGFNQLDGAERYPLAAEVPTMGADFVLQPGMTFAFEPSCMFGRRYANLGGTVVISDTGAIELNKVTTQMMRA
ncbi:M24 family metallopeptidase [Mesobacterium sp. TK19101]|uniref:M24 family metallopeptidase n=1 Tax=Mesobacterium hydrothermale TaxID=3111907 RepID=A0ABU6HGC5_9RHOB|nr:M24 family metallopeptidase [Mesobacterium sp. TK19101]MEC3861406.1 M24 family metallopeptidase [Mesobacterium sp. TK19101]